MGDRRFALHQTFGNTFAHSGKLNARPGTGLGRGWPRGLRLAAVSDRGYSFCGSAHVSLGYAAFRAGSFHAAKVDAELSRDPSRHWRCFHPRFRFLQRRPCRPLWLGSRLARLRCGRHARLYILLRRGRFRSTRQGRPRRAAASGRPMGVASPRVSVSGGGGGAARSGSPLVSRDSEGGDTPASTSFCGGAVSFSSALVDAAFSVWAWSFFGFSGFFASFSGGSSFFSFFSCAFFSSFGAASAFSPMKAIRWPTSTLPPSST